MSKWLLKILEKIISKLKKEEYFFSSSLQFSDIVSLVCRRCIQIIRGSFYRCFIRGKGTFFCGKGVKLYHKSNLHIGANSIIGDNSYIDALAKNEVEIGDNVTLGRNVNIKCTGVIRSIGEGLVIGNRVAIGDNSIVAAQGGVIIGDDTIIGPGVLINAENHIYENKDVPIRLQGERRKGVVIGKNCWIGGNVTIVDGVTIGNHCVIGAGSVVTKNVESDSMVLGIPASVKKKI